MFLIWFVSFCVLCNYIIEKKETTEKVKTFCKWKLKTYEPVITTAPVDSVSAAGSISHNASQTKFF